MDHMIGTGEATQSAAVDELRGFGGVTGLFFLLCFVLSHSYQRGDLH